jgi:uncharacterized protein DUF5615
VRARFQADADLNQTIVLAAVRQEPMLDFQTALDAGLRGLPDREVLALAARSGRVLVSHDLRTMPRHFADFTSASSSSGLILVPQHLPVAAVADAILLIWSVTEAAEWIDRLLWLPL